MGHFQARQRLERAARLGTQVCLQRAQIAASAQLPAMLIDHAEIHEEMRRQHVGLDIGPHDVKRRGQAHQLQHRVHQRAMAKGLGRVQCRRHFCGRIGQRHQTRAGPLVQGFNQRLHLVLQHARHQPFAALIVHLVQHKQGHRHGQAVFGITGFVKVGCGAVHAAQANGFWE